MNPTHPEAGRQEHFEEMKTELYDWPVGVKAVIRCDGCGCFAPMIDRGINGWHKPELWYSRGDDDGTQVACSRGCIERISRKSGKTGVVIPI